MARLLQSALCGGALWSAAELLRLLFLDLLRFSGPWQLVLFVGGHLGLCVAGALVVCAAYAAPVLITGRRGLLLIWHGLLCGLTIGLGCRLSFRVAAAQALPVLLIGAAVAAVFVTLLGADLPALRDCRSRASRVPRAGRVPHAAPRAALCLLGAAAACALNQGFLPHHLFHFHAAATSFGLGLASLAAAYVLPPARRGAPAAALLLFFFTAAACRDDEARHALFVLGQESRVPIYAARKLARRAGGLGEWQGAPVPPGTAPGTTPPGGRPAATPACAPARARRVVLITIDSLRPDHLRAYGYARETAPRLSRLAARAVVFDRAYAGAPATVPALRRLFAVAPAAGGPVSWLGRSLAAAGVDTGAVVSAGLLRSLGAGIAGAFTTITALPGPADAVDRDIAAAAARALAAPAPGPQLLWVHLAAPHLPYRRWPEGPDYGPRARDRYDGEIAEADRALGQVLDAAARHPLAAATAVVLTADHGEELHDHGGEAHGRYGMFEEEVRVPLLIAVPGAAPRRVPESVSHDDLGPTVVGMLIGCGPGPGRSLLPALSGAPLPPAPVLIGPRAPLLSGALIDGRFKLAFLLFNRSQALYDLATDPAERINLLHRRPEVAARMQALLRAALSALPPGFQPGDW